MKYNKLEVECADRLVFVTAPHPVTTSRGLVIGGGKVYPELNFTLPPMTVSKENMKEVSRHYREIVKGSNYIDATVKGCLKGMEIIENALETDLFKRDEREDVWMDTIKQELLSIPIEEDTFVEEILPTIDRDKIILEEYGL